MGGVLNGFSKPLYTGWTKQTVSRERNVGLDGKLRPVFDESLSLSRRRANEETASAKTSTTSEQTVTTTAKRATKRCRLIGMARPPPSLENHRITNVTPHSVARPARTRGG